MSNITHLLIVDFEATCTDTKFSNRDQMEIIEFPIIVLDIKHNMIVDEFHMFVKPTINPILTDFCKDLTGIAQEVVDNAKMLECVIRYAEVFISKYPNAAFVTDGDWDLRDQLPKQLNNERITISDNFANKIKNYKNLKREYVRCYIPKHLRTGKYLTMKEMMRKFCMKFEGHLHSGIDDARNITRIVQQMIKDGHQWS